MHTRLLYEIQFEELQVLSAISVTRLVDLLHFGQLFRVCGNSYFAQIAHIFSGIFCKGVKSCIFLVISFLGNIYWHLPTSYWSHWFRCRNRLGGQWGRNTTLPRTKKYVKIEIVVAQLAEWSFPTLEDLGSNPAIWNFIEHLLNGYCKEKNVERVRKPLILTKYIVCQVIRLNQKERFILPYHYFPIVGSGCSSVGRAVASDNRDPWFESSHRQILCTINCIWKTVLNRRK